MRTPEVKQKKFKTTAKKKVQKLKIKKVSNLVRKYCDFSTSLVDWQKGALDFDSDWNTITCAYIGHIKGNDKQSMLIQIKTE